MPVPRRFDASRPRSMGLDRTSHFGLSNALATGARICPLLLVLLMPASCSDENATGPTLDGGEVEVEFDEAAAVSETIDASGGTIQLTTADGTDVTVTVPAGARRSSTTLTVVPLTRLEGAPFSSLVGAVEIRPSDVMFAEPVTITFRPAETPVELGVAFVVDEVDTESGTRAATTQEVAPGVFVVNCKGGAREWTVGVGMSGIAGVAKSSIEEVLDFLGSGSPTSLMMRMKAQAGPLIYTRENLERFANGDCDLSLILSAPPVMIDLYNSMLRPALVAAKTSNGLDYFDALRGYLSWAADNAVLGIEGEASIQALNSEAVEFLNIAAVNAANQFLSHCAGGSFDGLVLSALGRNGLKALLATPELPFLDDPQLSPDNLIQRLQECLGCDDITIFDVRPPALPLKGSLGRFEVNFTGSTPENTQFFWDFGDDVAAEDRVRTEASPVIRLPQTPGTYFGAVFLQNECSTEAFDASFAFSYTVIDCDDPAMNELLSVTSVSPLSGAPATEVTFRAVVGGPVAEYTWDFGDAAVPRISHEPEPVVTLGAERDEPYLVVLSVGNACGSSEPFIFEFRICPVGSNPVEITAISSLDGMTGTMLTVQPSVTGEPVDYQWDFGGGASPTSSSEPEPVVTLGLPGTYQGSLRITGPCGDEDVKAFSFNVASNDSMPPYDRAFVGTHHVSVVEEGGSFSCTDDTPVRIVFEFDSLGRPIRFQVTAEEGEFDCLDFGARGDLEAVTSTGFSWTDPDFIGLPGTGAISESSLSLSGFTQISSSISATVQITATAE